MLTEPNPLSDPHAIEDAIDRALTRNHWIALGSEAAVEQIVRWLEHINAAEVFNGLNVAELIRSGAWRTPPDD